MVHRKDDLLVFLKEIIGDNSQFQLSKFNCTHPRFYHCNECGFVTGNPQFVQFGTDRPIKVNPPIMVYNYNHSIDGYVACARCKNSLIDTSTMFNAAQFLVKEGKGKQEEDNYLDNLLMSWDKAPAGKDKKQLREKIQETARFFHQYVTIYNKADKSGVLAKWCIENMLRTVSHKSIEIKAGLVWLVKVNR